MKLTSKPLAAILFVILFGGIIFTTLMGWWRTKTSKVPQTYTEGEVAGQYNPADIRGSYTFGDISSLFEIPLDDLAAAFRLPEGVDTAAFQVKSLEAQYGELEAEIGTPSLRLFVAWYKGLPYEPVEETYLPLDAVRLLKQKSSLTPEQLDYLEAHMLDFDTAALTEGQPEPIATPESTVSVTPTVTLQADHAQPERTITGKTTFQQLLDWGVSGQDIEQVLGRAMPSPTVIIREYASSKGEEFSALKTHLQSLVDAAQP